MNSLPNIMWLIKLKEMEQAGPICGKKEMHVQGFCSENLKKRVGLEDPCADGRTTQNWILKKQGEIL